MKNNDFAKETILRQANEIKALKQTIEELKAEIEVYKRTNDDVSAYVESIRNISKDADMYRKEYERLVTELREMKETLTRILFDDKYKKIKKKISG